MAGVSSGWDVPFNRLPDEVIINIFSFLTFDELLNTVQEVCLHWRQLAHAPLLWGNKEYAIRGRCWRLQGRNCCGVYFSECIHCKCDKTDEEVLRTVGTMPQLRRLTIMRAIRGKVLREFCVSCPNITNLQIECGQKVDPALMMDVFTMCKKIQKLKLPACMVSNQRCAEQLLLLKRLRCLIVFEDLRNSKVVSLSALTKVSRLEELHSNCKYFVKSDVEHFLKAKKDDLTALTLGWNMGLDEEWCLLTLLKQYKLSIRKLRLLNYHMRPEMESTAFRALGALRSLHELDAQRVCPTRPQLLSLPFQPGCLTQLQRLKLQHATNLLDDTVVTISQNCTHLRELRLRNSENITDVAMTEISRLKHLEILELSGCNRLGGAAIGHIAQLPALHTLVLQMIDDMSKLQPSLQQIVNIKLYCLDIFNSKKIAAVPFDEFPEKMKRLRELRVPYDREEKKAVAELERKMPDVKIFYTYWHTEDDLPTGSVEMSDGDGEGADDYYAGDDYYYGSCGSYIEKKIIVLEI